MGLLKTWKLEECFAVNVHSTFFFLLPFLTNYSSPFIIHNQSGQILIKNYSIGFYIVEGNLQRFEV